MFRLANDLKYPLYMKLWFHGCRLIMKNLKKAKISYPLLSSYILRIQLQIASEGVSPDARQ